MTPPSSAAVDDLERQIEHGMEVLGLHSNRAMLRKFRDFIDLLCKWNRTYNLTAIREPELMVSNHLLDSLAVAPFLVGECGIDVGSGGGFPGVPLAIAAPQRRVTLLDSSQKRTAFLRQAAAELKLANVEVVCERVENWKPAAPYDWVISRAFAELPDFVRAAGHLVSGGVLAAMKGAYPREEIERLPPQYRVREVVPLVVPGLEAKRHLVLVERT